MTAAGPLLRLRRLRARWRSDRARWARLRATERATRRRLGRADLRRLRAYAHDVLGDAGYAPELGCYLLVAGAFREGWVPPSFFAHVVMPFLHPLLANVSRARSFTRHLLPLDPFPDLVTLVHGAWFDRAGERLTTARAHALLFADASRAVMRIDRVAGQGGVRIVHRHDDLAPLAAGPNAVFHPLIPTHPHLARAAPNATLALTTVLLPAAAAPDAGTAAAGVSVRTASLRVPTDAFALPRSPRDALASLGPLRLAIDVPTGVALPGAYDRDWRHVRHHPISGQPFERLAIPGFHAAAALCADLHARLPHAAIVGWEVAIGPDERVHVLDWDTCCPSPAATEPLTGPSFADLGWERLRAPVRDDPVVVTADTLV